MNDEFDYSGDLDHMELGSSGLIPQEDGWFLDKYTGNRVDPEGRVYSPYNELLYDPFEEDPYYE